MKFNDLLKLAFDVLVRNRNFVKEIVKFKPSV